MSCPDCFRGTIHNHDPGVEGVKGYEETIHGKRTYIATPTTPADSQSTILFVTDAFGIDFINNKVLADKYAAGTGLRVLLPDFIPGGGMSTSVMGIMDQISEPVSWWNVWGQLKRIGAVFRAIWHVAPFMMRASPAKSYPSVLEWTRKLKADMPAGAKLGVAGFCWGGYQSTNMSKEPAVEGGSVRLVDAQFCAHPSGLSLPDMIVDAVTTFRVPYSLAQADVDIALPTKKVLDTEARLRQAVGDGQGEGGYNYEIKIWKDCHHGFAVRSKPGEGEGAEGAKDQAIEWFKKYL
jgi:dienelactone hydrolase